MADALHFEDLTPGRTFRSGALAVGAEDIRAFAPRHRPSPMPLFGTDRCAMAFDPQPFHLDDAAARGSPFGGLAASGWHTAALTMRLLVDGGLPVAGGIVGAGGEIAWPRSVRPGDTLRVESEVVEARPSRSKPFQGTVRVRTTTLNQDGQPVQVLTATLVVPRRSA